MKIAIILGTRPEIIKMSPIIRECERKGIDHYILHTGQHYSFEMYRVFFEELELAAARYNLDVGSDQKSSIRSDFLTFCSLGVSGTHGQQTATMLSGIEEFKDIKLEEVCGG